jgi:colanic acid/amylovoran biosynthesis protein
MKSVLILGLHSALNSGDAALVTVAVSMARRAFPGHQIVLSANHPRSYQGYADKTIGSLVSSIWNRPKSKASARKIWTALSLPVALCVSAGLFPLFRRVFAKGLLREQTELLCAIADADVVLACPGGYLYGRPGVGSFIGTVFPFAVAGIFGKRVIYLSQSIGPCRTRWQKSMLKRLLQQAGAIMVRERNSRQFVTDLLGSESKSPMLVPDFGFAYVGESHLAGRDFLRAQGVPIDSGVPCVGVTVLNHATQTGDADIQTAYESAILAALNQYANALGTPLHVLWLPQCRGPGFLEDDREVIRRMMARGLADDRVVMHTIADDVSLGLLWACYGCLDVLIATRMHSGIFALSQGVPVVAISYLYKTEGIMAELGLQDWVVAARGITASDITSRLLAVTKKRVSEDPLRLRLDGLRAQLETLADLLPNL